MREIREETGYDHVKLVATSETIHDNYFSFAKNEHRDIEAVGLYFELVDDHKIDAQLEDHERGKFIVEWIDEKTADERVKDQLHRYLFDKFIRGKGYYVGDGVMWNSGRFNGLGNNDAKKQITDWLEQECVGKKATNYKLRDWIFSRQRYWGEPIPIVKCEKCGTVPVPEKDLPVKLPKVKSYEPTGTGESPLANIKKWVEVKCPSCKGEARRETNTMPQWAGSCWYYLGYCLKNQRSKIKDQKLGLQNFKAAFDYWSPVDLYIGGIEHAVLHLLYARFWHKVLFDIGVVGTKEPFQKLMNQGLMAGPDGQKMSKSRGNVVSPDDMIVKFGADSLRAYEMFMGPFEAGKSWDPHGITGVYRFLNRVWEFVNKNKAAKQSSEQGVRATHRLVKKVTGDIEEFRFNTAISACMIFMNDVENLPLAKKELLSFVKILSPFAPHIAQELVAQLGEKKLLDTATWPAWDESLVEEAKFEMVVQINGRARGKVVAKRGITEDEAKSLALASGDIQKWVEGKPIQKIIYVQNRLINLLV